MTANTDSHRLAKLLITIFVVFAALLGGAYLFSADDATETPPSPMGSGPMIEEQPGAVEELEFGPLDRPDGTAPADFRRPATSPEVMMNRTRAEEARETPDAADTPDAPATDPVVAPPPSEPESRITPPPRWSPDTDRTDDASPPDPDQSELANEIWEDRNRDAPENIDDAENTDDPALQAELEDEEALYDDDFIDPDDPDPDDPDAEPANTENSENIDTDGGLEEWQDVDNPAEWEDEAAQRARDSMDSYQTELDRFADSLDADSADSADSPDIPTTPGTPAMPGTEDPAVLAAMASRDALDVLYWLSAELGVARASAGTRRTVIERQVDSNVAGEREDHPPQTAENPDPDPDPDAPSPWLEITAWLWELQQSRFPELEAEVQAVDDAAQALEDLERDDPTDEAAHSEALLTFFEALETALDLMVDVGWDDLPVN